MAHIVNKNQCPENKLCGNPSKSNVLIQSSPESPISPICDADVANILSKDTPPANDSKANNEHGLKDPNSNCHSKNFSAEDKPDDGNALAKLDSSVPNGSVQSNEKSESTDENAVLDGDLSVPIFCLSIGEASETGAEKEMQTETPVVNLPYRDEKQSDSDDSSDSDCSSSDCSDSFLYEMRNSVKYVPAPKTYNVKPPVEESYIDLPSIEDLKITVKESEVEKIGVIEGIVDLQVVIHSREGLKPLQLDSVLFLSNEKPLGHVCDVFGSVKNPYYSVRFNSKELLEKSGVKKGMDVYYAPKRTEITQYVFAEELQKLKGSDASGKNDIEASDDNLDFSDDEKEREAKLRRKKKKQTALGNDSSNEPVWMNQQHHSQGSNEPRANPFYSMNNNRATSDRRDWSTQKPSSNFNNASGRQRHAFHRPSNFAHSQPQAHTPPPQSNFRGDVSFQPPQSPFMPPLSPYQTPDQSPYQAPSPLVRLQFHTPPQGGPMAYPPPSPLPFQQQQQPTVVHQSMGYHQQQHSPVINPYQNRPLGPPRPISLQQMHSFGQMTPLGPLSPAPHLSFAPQTISSPPPSTAFPPASPNFSYFSHPFPSAPSPVPSGSQQSFYHMQAPNHAPAGMQVMPPMSPLSIQIPNNMRSPPPPIGPNGYNQVNRNLLQQNMGTANRSMRRF